MIVVVNKDTNTHDLHVKYRHLIPTTVDRCLVVQTLMDNMSKGKESTSMTYVACKSKLHSIVKSSMPPCPGNWEALRRAVVHYARPVNAVSAGIKC